MVSSRTIQVRFSRILWWTVADDDYGVFNLNRNNGGMHDNN